MSLRLPPPAAPTDGLRFTALYFSCTVLAFSFGAVVLAVAMGIPYCWFSRWPVTPFLKALRAVGLVSCSSSTALWVSGIPSLGGIPVAGVGLGVLGLVLVLRLLDETVRQALVRHPSLASTRVGR